MMELVFSEVAEKELERLTREMQNLFLLHFEKMLERPPRKHMRYGIPCHVEKVTRQARIIYDIKEERIFVLHCFSTHKEYENWYNSYR